MVEYFSRNLILLPKKGHTGVKNVYNAYAYYVALSHN